MFFQVIKKKLQLVEKQKEHELRDARASHIELLKNFKDLKIQYDELTLKEKVTPNSASSCLH